MDPISMTAIMMGMQAAGMVFDWFGKENQKDIARKGARLEQRSIQDALQMTRLQTEDASLQAMRNLRSTLGSQAAVIAARGARPNPTFGNNAMKAFNEDESMRRINQTMKEFEAKTQMQLSRLHEKGYESQLDQAFYKRLFDIIPTSPSAYGSLGNFGKTNPRPGASGSVNRSGGGFGTTPFLG